MKAKKGCGWLLVVAGACLAALGLFIAVVSFVADMEAGGDPAPHIRQGGSFFLFGAALALGIIVVAVIPLLVGLLLLRKSKLNNS